MIIQHSKQISTQVPTQHSSQEFQILPPRYPIDPHVNHVLTRSLLGPNVLEHLRVADIAPARASYLVVVRYLSVVFAHGVLMRYAWDWDTIIIHCVYIYITIVL